MVHLDIIISRANIHMIAVQITLSKFKLDRWGTLRYEVECAKVLLLIYFKKPFTKIS